jgi:hypothetical protein
MGWGWRAVDQAGVMGFDMDVLTDHLAEARSAHQRHDWRGSYAAFVRADGFGPMALADLDAYATAAWRLGESREAVRLAERVYRQLVRTDTGAAGRKATVLGLEWLARGHDVIAVGWADTARLLLVDVPADGARGYLAYLDAASAIATADAARLAEAAVTLRDNAVQSGDAALTVLGQAVDGVSALMESRKRDGCRLLDQALLPVVDERVPFEWAGDVYRIVLTVGRRQADRDHVVAWTQSMQRWCELTGVAQDLVSGPRR